MAEEIPDMQSGPEVLVGDKPKSASTLESEPLGSFFKRLGSKKGSRIWREKGDRDSNDGSGSENSSIVYSTNDTIDVSVSNASRNITSDTSITVQVISHNTPSEQLSYKARKFGDLLSEDVVNLSELRKISWNGVPCCFRPVVWKLISGYMPLNKDRRESTLQRKRKEYNEAVSTYFDIDDSARTQQEQSLLRQILVDIPRTAPGSKLFRRDTVQKSMTRALYVWAVRHPATGYVQGINDLITPFYMVFLTEHVSFQHVLNGEFSDKHLIEVEADSYWCLTKLLDQIQDHYTAAQTGLQRMVYRLEELIRRIDTDLYNHLTSQGVHFMQFAFRWMNCLLMRELPLAAVLRIWDTYLSEEAGFDSFHVYMCAALLCKYSTSLTNLDFSALIMFLQDMPTQHWNEENVEPLLSQAYILSTLFEHTSAHFNT